MGWYSMQGTNVNPDDSDLFRWIPSEANSKEELVNRLIRAYNKTREEGDPVDDVEWIRYFTGWKANCGEIYLLSRSYANSIGYNGAVTFKNSDFMIVHGRNLDTSGFAPISKSKMLSKSGRFKNIASFKIDRIKKERRQSESERTEGLFQSIDWIIDKYPTIPIQPKTRVDDYSMIMQFPSKSLVTEEMYSYIQSALMINGWNISNWNENEVIVHDFFTMIDDGVPLPNNGSTPRYDEIGKSATKDERYIKGGRVVDWVVGDNGTLTEFKVLDGESYSVTWYFDEQLLNDVENLDELPYDSAEYEIDFGITKSVMKSARLPKRSFNDMVKSIRKSSFKKMCKSMGKREDLLRETIHRGLSMFPSSYAELWWDIDAIEENKYEFYFRGTPHGVWIVTEFLEHKLKDRDFKVISKDESQWVIEDTYVENSGYESLLDEMVSIGHGVRTRMEYLTLREAIDKYGIHSLGNPNDYRKFARCPSLNNLVGPMFPNEGFIARYDDWESHDALSR